MSPTTERTWTNCFNLIGLALTLALVGLVLAGNTQLVRPFEHTGFPLSWALGIAAIFAFLAAELSDSGSPASSEQVDRSSQLAPEWEAVETCR
jgi:hypothetical protein